MRKTSYALTFIAVLAMLIINILSTRLPDWLIAKYEILNADVTVRYGLMQRCERRAIHIPGPSQGGRFEYTDYECRPFPLRVSDKCEDENGLFCAAWTSAQYFSELGIGFAGVALITLLIGVSTHSRRRRIWRAVAGLVLLHALFQMVTFAIITELYRKGRFPGFEQARPGVGYALNAVSWVLGILVAFGVIITGISADKGFKWAAGNRAYSPIQG
ncbi:hypothetical protein BJ138DRAFT_1169125 [Hygrophoropsis aurantiaca]|uniref:Uncharacterized protein n=1 Tax=Hygrophoropsis aurantiaca TaxID=72124 RepID=A0ACB8ASP8_9AGAM|nr:hypothetical protein BJ138DRAFT_1169125 [Hygrophoropsis aurantiaca]